MKEAILTKSIAIPAARLERVLIEQARHITGLPIRTLQTLAAQGEIPGAAKLGRRWTFNEERLRAWITEREDLVARCPGRPLAEIPSRLRLDTPEMKERYRKAIAAKLISDVRER